MTRLLHILVNFCNFCRSFSVGSKIAIEARNGFSERGERGERGDLYSRKQKKIKPISCINPANTDATLPSCHKKLVFLPPFNTYILLGSHFTLLRRYDAQINDTIKEIIFHFRFLLYINDFHKVYFVLFSQLYGVYR